MLEVNNEMLVFVTLSLIYLLNLYNVEDSKPDLHQEQKEIHQK